jgi:hypothetical protein
MDLFGKRWNVDSLGAMDFGLQKQRQSQLILQSDARSN